MERNEQITEAVALANCRINVAGAYARLREFQKLDYASHGLYDYLKLIGFTANWVDGQFDPIDTELADSVAASLFVGYIGYVADNLNKTPEAK